MIGVDIVRQSLEDNSNKEVSSDLLKKLSLMKIEERLSNVFSTFRIGDLFERIAASELSEEKQNELLKFASSEAQKNYKECEDALNDLFGMTKDIKDDEDEDEEKKVKAPDGDKNYRELDDNEKKQTPSEVTTEKSEGQVVFNY